MTAQASPLVVAVVLALAAVSCGDEGPATPPDMTGAYSATFTYVMTGDIEALDSCDGSIVIDQQTGGSFSGSFSIQAPGCDTREATGTLSGVIDTDGNISVGDLFEEFFDPAGMACTVTGGSTTLTGQKLSNAFSVSSQTGLRCGGADVVINLVVTATRNTR
jgi:hypothetical protein